MPSPARPLQSRATMSSSLPVITTARPWFPPLNRYLCLFLLNKPNSHHEWVVSQVLDRRQVARWPIDYIYTEHSSAPLPPEPSPAKSQRSKTSRSISRLSSVASTSNATSNVYPSSDLSSDIPSNDQAIRCDYAQGLRFPGSRHRLPR